MRASALNTTKEIRGQPKAELDANSGNICQLRFVPNHRLMVQR